LSSGLTKCAIDPRLGAAHRHQFEVRFHPAALNVSIDLKLPIPKPGVLDGTTVYGTPLWVIAGDIASSWSIHSRLSTTIGCDFSFLA
jgi:hypothetical protein